MTSAEVTEILDLAELIVDLDLDTPRDQHHLIELLQERRSDHIEALTHADPNGASASMLHLRSERRREIEVCETALGQLGAPLEKPGHESGDDK